MTPREERRWDGIYLAAWTAFFLLLAVRHAPWRDEYQAWLVATRAGSAWEFIDAVRYERQPPLYYIWLFGLNLIGASLTGRHQPILLHLASWAASIASAYVVTLGFAAPRWLRYGVPLGFLFLFDYGIVARSYSLGVFLLLAAVWARNRARRPLAWLLLCLAGGVHLLFTLLASGLLVMDLWEHRKDSARRWTAGAVLTGLGLVGSLLFQYPPRDSTFVRSLVVSQVSLEGAARVVAYGLTGFDGITGPFSWNRNPWSGWVTVLPLALLVLMSWEGLRLRRFLLLIVAPLVVMLGSYEPGTRHAGVLYVALLILLLAQGPKPIPRTFAVLVLCMMVASARWLYAWAPFPGEPAFDFSGSKELVQTVGRTLARPDVLVITAESHVFFAPMGMLDIAVYDVLRDRILKYPDFRATDYKGDFRSWCRRDGDQLGRRFPGKTLFFGTALGSAPPPAECGEFQAVFRTRRATHLADERYVLYRRLT